MSSSRRNTIIGILFVLSVLWISGLLLLVVPTAKAIEPVMPNQHPWWPIQSIDTMKYSRDPSREYLTHPTRADEVIKTQISAIAQTGATHVAIATPYDNEFKPLLKKWVDAARQHGLKVWFRGNWAGWEGWFEYPKITRIEHLNKTRAFIIGNASLFEDGDIFTACPECENGGPGDPRMTNDAQGFRAFLIDEHRMMEDAFGSIDKNVLFHLNSMNGDVARLIMDKDTTKALGGVVTIDHYVSTPEKLANDIVAIAAQSGGSVVLGEFGAPIPDIHGRQNSAQQALWIQEALTAIAHLPQLSGVNYWTSFGGSTALWSDANEPKPAVATLTSFYKPAVINGVVRARKKPVADALIQSLERVAMSDNQGNFTLPTLQKQGNIIVSKPGYHDAVVSVADFSDGQVIELTADKVSFWQTLANWLSDLF